MTNEFMLPYCKFRYNMTFDFDYTKSRVKKDSMNAIRDAERKRENQRRRAELF
jgi:hypothetical protein